MAKKVVYEIVTNASRLVPFIFWQVASLGVLIILMCMLIFCTSSKQRLYSMMFCSIVLLGIVGLEYYERSQVWFIVTSEELPVYMGPDLLGKKYPRIYVLKLHDEVRVIKNQGGWLQIEDNGRKGWIKE